MPRWVRLILFVITLTAVLYFLLRQPTTAPGQREVVVYASVDSDFAIPIFDMFTRETGIHCIFRPDGEETKTTGLALRLDKMKANPDGDVFWNSEQSLTLVLADKGVLEPYISPNARTIPAQLKDAGGLWTGFGQRARVVIFSNRLKPEDVPKTLDDFANPRWKGRFAVAKPLYGTTLSHLAAVTLELGEDKAFALFRAWRANGVILAQSNGDVEERVSQGTADVGLTDSDDAFSAMDRSKPVSFRVLDQSPEWHGSFLIPNTVAMLKNCPHPAEAKAFIDFLLRPETEKWLAEHGARQIPVRDVGAKLAPPLDATTLKPVRIDPKRLSQHVLQLGETINRILSGEKK